MCSAVFQLVQKQPFTLSLDGSNDKEEQKLALVTVRTFDNDGKIQVPISTCLYSLDTASAHFEKVFDIPCIAYWWIVPQLTS